LIVNTGEQLLVGRVHHEAVGTGARPAAQVGERVRDVSEGSEGDGRLLRRYR
jgi:hypothetical protein